LGDTGANGTFAPVISGKIRGQNALGGTGGFGAGVGSKGNGQEGGGPDGSSGQGGSGFGGAIFVREGGILNINGPALFCSNFAEEGTSENGGITGSSAGTDLFMMTGSLVTLNPGAGNTITFNGSIADDSAATLDIFPFGRGSGADLTLLSGLALLNGTNTYSGQTTISGGSVLQASQAVFPPLMGISSSPSSAEPPSRGICPSLFRAAAAFCLDQRAQQTT
jgi:autotransporter-associated beta strand protein